MIVCESRREIHPFEDEQQFDNMEVWKTDEQCRWQPPFVYCCRRIQVLSTLERTTARRHRAAACRERPVSTVVPIECRPRLLVHVLGLLTHCDHLLAGVTVRGAGRTALAIG